MNTDFPIVLKTSFRTVRDMWHKRHVKLIAIFDYNQTHRYGLRYGQRRTELILPTILFKGKNASCGR